MSTGSFNALIVATNAGGSGTQSLAIRVLRPAITHVTVSATNAAGKGNATLDLAVYR